jgi:hypothetical protein
MKRSALLDVLTNWDGDKLAIDTTAGFTYTGWSHISNDGTVTYLEGTDGGDCKEVVVVDRIVAVRHLEES